jgi:ABC-type multidrug transport system fused ATPase/permease subunit
MSQLMYVLIIAGVALMMGAAVLIAVSHALQAAKHAATCTTLAASLRDALHRAQLNDVRVAELGDLCERLTSSVHRIRSREGMSNLRARETVDENLQGAAWKDKMRKQLKLATPGAIPKE